MNGRTATATCKQYSLFVCSVAWRQQWFTALVVTRHCLECLSTRLGWGEALHLAVESTLRLHAMPMQMRAAVCWCCNSHAPVICSWHHASEVQSSLTHSLQILHSQSSASSSTFKSLLQPGNTSALDATQKHRGPVTAHATTNVESKAASIPYISRQTHILQAQWWPAATARFVCCNEKGPEHHPDCMR